MHGGRWENGVPVPRIEKFLSYTRHFVEVCSKVTKCIKAKLSWSNLQQLRDIIFVLAVDRAGRKLLMKTFFWNLLIDKLSSFQFTTICWGWHSRNSPWIWSSAAVCYHVDFSLYLRLLCCLEAAHPCNMCFWMGQSTDFGRAPAFPPCFKWKLERVLSQPNIIKSNKTSSLANDTLNDLLIVSTKASSLKDFNPDTPIQLWWEDKVRRPTPKYDVYLKPFCCICKQWVPKRLVNSAIVQLSDNS